MDIDPIIVSTSLEALIERATKNTNEKIDSAAMIAFSGFVQRDPECAPLAAKCILAKIHSMQEWEALQALHLLDICMQTGSASFQAEVGKFRFLNELIRLVSPNTMQCNCIHTPELIKNKIIELLGLWSSQFPKEIKIQDALDMLKKQGVVKDLLFENTQSSKTSDSKVNTKVSILNGEKSILLQKLLKSKKSEDLKAANELIKSMVQEEEQKAEKINNMLNDIEITSNNVKLLSEMLKSYCNGPGSSSDLELIKELYNTVKQLEPKIKMSSLEIPENEDTVRKIIKLNYEINETFKIYNEVLENPILIKTIDREIEENLLDLNSTNSSENNDFLSESNCKTNNFSNNGTAGIKELDDFLQMSTSLKTFIPSLPENIKSPQKCTEMKENLLNVDLFEELNILGKVILNKPDEIKTTEKTLDLPDAEFNSSNIKKNGLSEESSFSKDSKTFLQQNNDNYDIKPLGDITLNLEDIVPCPDSTVVNLFNKNDISIKLHLAANKLRDDVTVFVVTTRSKCKQPLFNFSFQPVVPKDCRLRILPQSRTNLPIYNAFLPQETIVQIILVATQNKYCIPLKYVISYTMDDEMFTEFGETEQIYIN